MGENALAALRRWEASGATWELRTLDDAGADVDLVSCDGGEVMGRLVSADADFVADVRATAVAPRC
ncbi:MAG: hypothetical protein LCH96_01530 [Actinobacteria bacterium]|nr:hypothetical protein [Actinomycetota bacterium]